MPGFAGRRVAALGGVAFALWAALSPAAPATDDSIDTAPPRAVLDALAPGGAAYQAVVSVASAELAGGAPVLRTPLRWVPLDPAVVGARSWPLTGDLTEADVSRGPAGRWLVVLYRDRQPTRTMALLDDHGTARQVASGSDDVAAALLTVADARCVVAVSTGGGGQDVFADPGLFAVDAPP